MNNSNQPGFDYQIKRSRRKSLAIHVKHQQVEVRAPAKLPTHFIEDFVASKQTWVHKKLAEQKVKFSEKINFNENSLIPFLGIERLLSYQFSNKNKVSLEGNHLLIELKHSHNDIGEAINHKAKLIFEDWLKHQAKSYILPRSQKLSETLKLDKALKDVKFRKTKSKWGHCTANGTIQFNWQIMMTPEPVINYLIAHEVCHLAYMNHSPDYYDLLSKVCDDHKACSLWLRENEHRFLF